MRKLLLICSAVSLIYGNCVCGMDYDESELYENPWRDPNLDPLKDKVDKNAEKQEEETLSKNSVSDQKLKELLNLEREKVKKYEKALQKSQQLLAEEREKNEQLKTREQRVKTAESDQLLNDFNSKLDLHNADSGLEPQQTTSSETKGFKFKDFNAEHPEKLFNMEAQPTSNLKVRTKTLKPKKIGFNFSESKQNVTFLRSKRNQIQEQLFEAIKKGSLPDIQTAIKKGANVNDQDENGNTPLHWAAKSGNLENIKYLIKSGAKIDIKNEIGNAPAPLGGLVWEFRSC